MNQQFAAVISEINGVLDRHAGDGLDRRDAILAAVLAAAGASERLDLAHNIRGVINVKRESDSLDMRIIENVFYILALLLAGRGFQLRDIAQTQLVWGAEAMRELHGKAAAAKIMAFVADGFESAMQTDGVQ